MFFFFNDTATTEIYTLSLHDALPICSSGMGIASGGQGGAGAQGATGTGGSRSEEHTSELQSHSDLVCRLLLEKKKRTARPCPAATRPRSVSAVRARGAPSSTRVTRS